MARFHKTRIHPATAVLCLLGIYALAGLGYAAVAHSRDAVTVWAIVAVLAFAAAFGYQRHVVRKRRRAENAL